jgi:hypothetical protein
MYSGFYRTLAAEVLSLRQSLEIKNITLLPLHTRHNIFL